jgi:hypothetical protein
MRILYTLLIIYIVYRVFFNLVLPLIIRHFFQKAAQNMQGGYGQYQKQAPPSRQQGEVRIEDMGDQQSRNQYTSGDVEDVDYVEIK